MPGARIEACDGIVRQVAADGQGWSGVTWSQLDDSTADSAIAGQVGWFRRLAREFEWKLYDYDQPADLARRLTAAGFVPGSSEALMVAGTSAALADVRLPEGVRLLPVTDEAGVDLLMTVHERVFDTGPARSGRLRRALLSQVREAPGHVAMVVAMAGDEPVCSARVDFLPDQEFAGMWGGGTLPAWRGQGIYRALVAWRARLAADRGYRYLHVDASADSEPILARLGFAALARSTAYVWHPSR